TLAMFCDKSKLVKKNRYGPGMPLMRGTQGLQLFHLALIPIFRGQQLTPPPLSGRRRPPAATGLGRFGAGPLQQHVSRPYVFLQNVPPVLPDLDVSRRDRRMKRFRFPRPDSAVLSQESRVR